MAILRGKAYYAKVVGKPVEGYNPGELEWSVDIGNLTEDSKAQFIVDGFEDKIKNKGDERGDFITFRRKATTKDGDAAKPIRIVDADKNDWDGRLIGNGSDINLRYTVNDWTFGKKSGKKPSVLAIQVWNLVPYEGKGEDFEAKSGATGDAW